MSIFELSVYSPTIEETWKGTGIRRLNIDGPINEKWRETLEVVVYKVSKYLPSWARHTSYLPSPSDT
jgi:hypothetical protein